MLLGFRAESTVWGSGLNGWIFFLSVFIACRSWASCHLLSFFTGRIGLLQGYWQGLRSPCLNRLSIIGLVHARASLLHEYSIWFLSKLVVAQLLSPVWLFETPWTAAHQASLYFTLSLSLLKLMSIESVMPSNQVILCCSLLLLPSIFPSIRVFSQESALHIRWPKYWSFSFGISSSNEYSGLISFRMDWLDLLAVQGTLKSLLHTTVQSINSLVLSFL